MQYFALDSFEIGDETGNTEYKINAKEIKRQNEKTTTKKKVFVVTNDEYIIVYGCMCDMCVCIQYHCNNLSKMKCLEANSSYKKKKKE